MSVTGHAVRRGQLPNRPIDLLPSAGRDATLGAVLLRTLLLVGGLLPLAAMIVALFAAAWIRESRRAEAAPARRSELSRG